MEKNYGEEPPVEREKNKDALTEEEQAMRDLLKESYVGKGISVGALMADIMKWREAHPDATFGDAIRALYQKIEEEK